MNDRLDWTEIRAPSHEVFSQIAQQVWNNFPEDFKALAPEVIFYVEDLPPEELMDDLEIDSPYEVFGLFMSKRDHDNTVLSEEVPRTDVFWIFRRPLLDYWVDEGLTLQEVIIRVLVTEMGQYFGLSDHERALVEVAAGGRQIEMIH